MFSLAAAVSAQTVYTDGYLMYVIEDGGIAIVGYTGTEQTVIVPEMIGGYPVSEISEGAFADCRTVTEVVLPETVMVIEQGAFTSKQTYEPAQEGAILPEPTPAASGEPSERTEEQKVYSYTPDETSEGEQSADTAPVQVDNVEISEQTEAAEKGIAESDSGSTEQKRSISVLVIVAGIIVVLAVIIRFVIYPKSDKKPFEYLLKGEKK